MTRLQNLTWVVVAACAAWLIVLAGCVILFAGVWSAAMPGRESVRDSADAAQAPDAIFVDPDPHAPQMPSPDAFLGTPDVFGTDR